jgi:DNA invertase Pin-like site-specific DNA recombinase
MTDEISDEERRKRWREWGRAGGKKGGAIGGKRRLETMSKAQRTALAYQAGVQGGRPVVIDHERVKALRAEGMKYREIAQEMGISLASVARILKGVKKG